MNKSSFLIVGQHAVIEALRNPKRKVLKVFLTEESKKIFTEKIQKKMSLKMLRFISNQKKNWINTLLKIKLCTAGTLQKLNILINQT